MSDLILIGNILCLVRSILFILKPHQLNRAKLIRKNIKFLLHHGAHITFNILLMTLGYSRYKLAKVTFDRTTEILQDALIEFFEQLQSVPHALLTDNMNTVLV